MESSRKNAIVEQEKKSFILKQYIHKGETHRSTLLVLNTVFLIGMEHSYEILELLNNYLIGHYIDLENISNLQLKRETKNALKLAYVAFSRPTHLVAIGIHKDKLTEKLKEELIEFGWKEW